MRSGLPTPLRDANLRRAFSIPAVGIVAATLTGSIGVWAPAATVLDLASAPRKMPRVRLLSFALAWSTLESIGIGLSAALWATGHRDDQESHFSLQRWWADRLVDALRLTANMRFEVLGLDQLRPGPLVMCINHSSIADALIPAWLLGRVGMRPRYVLKDDLQLDPCLDIVGNRLPNHFVDRDPGDNAGELAQLEELAHDMNERDACVIYPEGMVVTDERRNRAMDSISRRDPQRARRVRQLRALAPVRPGGTGALLRGAPGADVVFVVHTGLEALRRLADAPARIPLDQPVRIEITRVARKDVPEADAFIPWFDDQWHQCDRRLTAVHEPF